MHQSGATSAGPAADVALSDWLPVVELVLVSDEEAATAMPKVLPHVCRLIAESAGSFVSSVPRHLLEYAYESAESSTTRWLEYSYESAERFYDEVVTAMLGTSPSSPTGGDNQGAEEHSCPYSILGIAKSAAPSQVLPHRCVGLGLLPLSGAPSQVRPHMCSITGAPSQVLPHRCSLTGTPSQVLPLRFCPFFVP
ncbi:unnamed protein product [Closterium sp. Naga37s-1]|nr:unnamed protein product [Closterium sp. Naga37s-1]